MTGCGLDAMPDLTDEESAIITEYAAGLLLKYSPNYNYRLVDDVEDLEPEDEIIEQPEEQSTQPETTAEQETLAETSDTDKTQQAQVETAELQADNNTVSIDSDLAQALGLNEDENVTIVYSSYEICDSYPETSTGFSVSATQGGKLLVVHFDLKNEAGSDSQINLMDYNLSATATVNEERSSKALNTLLPNDMISYYNSMKSAQVDDVVMLFQINDDLADSLEKISLTVSAGGNSVGLDIK
jgi:hypothetical protein